MEKNKMRKVTAQCIGIVLICFALGLFVGGLFGHHIYANDFLQAQINQEESNTKYILGSQKTSDYRISFDETPAHLMGKNYTIEGEFKNTTEGHFSSVELNFSLLDEEGKKIDDLKACCDGLSPGQAWKFVAANEPDSNINGAGYTVMLDTVKITF